MGIIPSFYAEQLKRQQTIITNAQVRINQLCAQLDFAEQDGKTERIREIHKEITKQAKIKFAAREKAEEIARRAE